MTYTIQTKDGKQIPMYFGTWSLSRFCELNGNLSFSQMQELFTTSLSFNHIITLLLCGAEHSARKNGKQSTYTDIDAGDWIDEMGGLTGKSMNDLMLVVGRAINPAYQGVEIETDKKPAKKKPKQAGLISE
jgi:hypothetical protein